MRYPEIAPILFKKNRQKLLGMLEKDSVAIIHSNDQMVRSGDQYFPYRQSPDLFYLSGIEQEMSVLMITPGNPEPARLFIRKADPNLETWEGKKLDRESASKISGISSVHWLDDFEKISQKLISAHPVIYTNVQKLEKFKPEYPLRDERMRDELKKEYPGHEFRELAPLMAELRLIKEPEEVDLIREAIRITRSGFERILKFVRPGIHEYEVEAELSHEFIRQGCSAHAYLPIIASGANACFLHYIKNNQVCREGQLLLMDFGAEFANYAADCSRTIPVNGKYTKRQKELYEACYRVFEQARSLLKPGTSIDEINIEVAKFWEEEHIKLGLYTNLDLKAQKKEESLYRQYYPHGTSHFMGIDVHDAGSKKTILKPGMILTCEPGIYIPAEETGIRLENDILITENGNTDLMGDFPIQAADIENLMNC